MSTRTATALSIGRVALTVQDLARVSAFYQQVAGLHLLKGDAASAELGVEGRTLLELRRDPSARRRSPREAGLFHTAFLLPSRGDLGRWIEHAMKIRAPVVGASDHGVSEALYLSDPEGNGIEIYADRPLMSWQWKDGQVAMPSDPLDVEDIVAGVRGQDWNGFPAGSVVGHVHLQVGAIAPAEAFYHGRLGFDITCRYPGGTFYAANGYHHHLATNVWNSRGAAERSFPSTGLTDVEILAPPAFIDGIETAATQQDIVSDNETSLSLRDPWGTPITFRREQP